jgi:hypothetical protein
MHFAEAVEMIEQLGSQAQQRENVVWNEPMSKRYRDV